MVSSFEKGESRFHLLIIRLFWEKYDERFCSIHCCTSYNSWCSRCIFNSYLTTNHNCQWQSCILNWSWSFHNRLGWIRWCINFRCFTKCKNIKSEWNSCIWFLFDKWFRWKVWVSIWIIWWWFLRWLFGEHNEHVQRDTSRCLYTQNCRDCHQCNRWRKQDSWMGTKRVCLVCRRQYFRKGIVTGLTISDKPKHYPSWRCR